MPFVLTTENNVFAGARRTQAAADEAAAADPSLTAVQGAIADADIPMDAEFNGAFWVVDTVATDTEPSRKIVTNVDPDALSPRQAAAKAARDGLLISFYAFVETYSAGEEPENVDKVKTYLWQAARAVMMAFANDVEIAGSAVTLTDAQFIAWANTLRLGPSDTSVITALGVYNEAGLYEIFERADDPAVLNPTGPVTWVGLDVTQWTGGVPNRLTVAQIAPVLGDAPSRYLNIYDYSWLEG